MPACIGRPPLESPQGLPTNSSKSGDIRRQSTDNGSVEHHIQDSDNSGATTVRVSGARRGVLHQSATLAAAVWVGESGTTADFRGVR